MEKEVKIIEKKFDLQEYNENHFYELYTQDNKRVTIKNEVRLDKASDDITYIGLIENDNKYIVNSWDELGNDVNGNNNNNLKMVAKITPNYNHITIEDVPIGDDEFDKKYEDFCKYNFKMSAVEYLRYKEFCKDHSLCVLGNGAIGGGIVVSFMPTGLGNIVHAKCENCGLEVDLTDETCW